MTDERFAEVYRQHRTSQDAYTYFILAAAASAIGFALNQTNGRSLSWSLAPLGIATASWLLSFYWGCRYLQSVGSILLGNLELLRVQAGEHPKAATPHEIAIASRVINERLAEKSEQASTLAKRQFAALIAGGVFYIVWHVLEMYLRTH
ncbi:MAG: hypothetical protein ACHQ9S_00870 [Candidatus Binatia bacterium]